MLSRLFFLSTLVGSVEPPAPPSLGRCSSENDAPRVAVPSPLAAAAPEGLAPAVMVVMRMLMFPPQLVGVIPAQELPAEIDEDLFHVC